MSPVDLDHLLRILSMKPVPPPAAVGAPGTEPEAKKAKKVKRNAYPGLFNAAGEVIKLEAVPTDFDSKAFVPLKKRDFKDESLFLEHNANLLEAKAKSLREQADKMRKLGNSASSGKLKTLLKMQDRMAEIIASLKAEGLDIDSMLAEKKTE